MNIDLYSNAAQTQTTYVIPGPPLYAGVKGGSSPAPAPSSSSAPRPTTSVVSVRLILSFLLFWLNSLPTIRWPSSLRFLYSRHLPLLLVRQLRRRQQVLRNMRSVVVSVSLDPQLGALKFTKPQLIDRRSNQPLPLS